jgi:hypothetical protein
MRVECDDTTINRAIAPTWIITDNSRALIPAGYGQVGCHRAVACKWLLLGPNHGQRVTGSVGGRSTLWSPGIMQLPSDHPGFPSSNG